VPLVGFDDMAQHAAAEQLYQGQLAALPSAKLKMNTNHATLYV